MNMNVRTVRRKELLIEIFCSTALWKNSAELDIKTKPRKSSQCHNVLCIFSIGQKYYRNMHNYGSKRKVQYNALFGCRGSLALSFTPYQAGKLKQYSECLDEVCRRVSGWVDFCTKQWCFSETKRIIVFSVWQCACNHCLLMTFLR